MLPTMQKKIPTPQKHDEQILVVKRNYLFPQGIWQGLKPVDFDHYLHIIQCKQEFHPRSIMEHDPTYKQIIPYLIFENNNTYFLMQRQSTASETRLQNKYSLGIGGHIRQEDLKHSYLSMSLEQMKNETDSKYVKKHSSPFAQSAQRRIRHSFIENESFDKDRSAEQGEVYRRMENNSNPIFNWAKREFHEEVNYDGNLEIEPLGILNDDSNNVGKVHLGFVLLLHGNSNQISVKSELKSGKLISLDECAKHQERMESWSQLVLAFLQRPIQP